MQSDENSKEMEREERGGAKRKKLREKHLHYGEKQARTLETEKQKGSANIENMGNQRTVCARE